jgi:hypothetical protein
MVYNSIQDDSLAGAQAYGGEVAACGSGNVTLRGSYTDTESTGSISVPSSCSAWEAENLSGN